MNKTMHLGLVGKDVSKSDSEKIHTFILSKWGIDCVYQRFSVQKEDFDSVMRVLFGDFDGFNITIPYKRDIFGYLDEVADDAMACGSVNTVVCETKCGYNTDGLGFLQMLDDAGINVANQKVLVLGAGGSGRSTAVALKNAGANVYMYRRNQAELQETCTQLGVQAAQDIEKGGFDVVINCTGVGMHDTEGVSPVTESTLQGAKWAVDLIYTPQKSRFLELAENVGVQILNGAAMLFYQAYFADCLYLGRRADKVEAKTLYQQYVEKYGK